MGIEGNPRLDEIIKVLDSPFPTSTFSTSARALCASRGSPDNITEADIVSGRSAPWSSSGIGVVPLPPPPLPLGFADDGEEINSGVSRRLEVWRCGRDDDADGLGELRVGFEVEESIMCVDVFRMCVLIMCLLIRGVGEGWVLLDDGERWKWRIVEVMKW